MIKASDKIEEKGRKGRKERKKEDQRKRGMEKGPKK